MDIYDFEVKAADKTPLPLKDYTGKVLLLVNTASKCGFTPQYEELERLYRKYKNDGLIILAFPCNQFHEQEPEDSMAVRQFCKKNYGVSFPICEKIEVNGDNAIPLYRYLTEHTVFQGFDPSHALAGKLDEILSANDPGYKNSGSIKWNFTKFLINRNGKIAARFEPTDSMEKVDEAVLGVLHQI